MRCWIWMAQKWMAIFLKRIQLKVVHCIVYSEIAF